MIPRPTSPERNPNNPSPMTTTPTALKNIPAYFLFAKDAEPNDKKASMGNVPRANVSIIKKPDIKDPLLSAETCIDWVNPHGKKNVPKPRINGVNVLCSMRRKKPKTPEGSVILLFTKIPTKFKPKSNIIIEANSPNIVVKVRFMPIAFPIIPSIPPSKANPINLPE